MNQLPMLSAVQIAADRVLLRKARDTDRDRIIEPQTDPEVGAHMRRAPDEPVTSPKTATN